MGNTLQVDGRAVGPDATLDLGMASERDGPAAPSSGPMPGGPMPGGLHAGGTRESPARGTAQQPEVHRPSSERLPAISAGLGEPGDGRSVANATGPGPRPKDDVAETLPGKKDLPRARNMHEFKAFVPDFACRTAFANLGEVPYLRQELGAVALVDISGFTPLTEKLSKRGHCGVELLTETLNNFFSVAIDTIYEHGGDVVKFAGDALLITFRPADSRDKGCIGSAMKVSPELRKAVAQIQQKAGPTDTNQNSDSRIYSTSSSSDSKPRSPPVAG